MKEPLWYRLSTPLLKRTDMTPIEKLVLTVLLDQCEETPRELTLKEIAEEVGTPYHTVQRAIDHLHSTGAIAREHTSGGACRYAVVVSEWLPPKNRNQSQNRNRNQSRNQSRNRSRNQWQNEQPDNGLTEMLEALEQQANCF